MPTNPPSRRLSPVQRRALAVLADRRRNGVTQHLLAAHGFQASLIADLVDDGLAIMMAEKIRAVGKTIEVVKTFITRKGRDVLAKK